MRLQFGLHGDPGGPQLGRGRVLRLADHVGDVDVLLAEGLISRDDLAYAQQEQERTGRSLGRVLIDLELFTEADLVAALANHLGLEFVSLADTDIDAVASSMIPEQLARRYCVLPFALRGSDQLLVAMSDPSNVLALDDIRTITDRDVQPVVATRTDIMAAIDRYARMGDSVEDVAGEFDTDEEDEQSLAQMTGVVDDAPIVKFVNALITKAVQDRASDIHIEPGEQELLVRYRVDGVLHTVTTQSRKILPGVVSRLKIMAELDIAERRVPQDGRISLKVAGKAIDLRVSSLPTVFGEKVVMRILDKSSVLLELSDLGFLESNYERYEQS